MRYIFILLVFIVPQLEAQESSKFALVIGNSEYGEDESSWLENPTNDSKLISYTLEKLDFNVTYHENIKNKAEASEIFKSYKDLIENAQVSLIYYAGHGLQINQENYIVPTQVKLKDEFDVEDYCFPINRITKLLDNENNDDRTNIMILDACRDNPFELSMSRSLKGSGLTKQKTPSGTFIAYSTGYGETADDSPNEKNSLYCTSLNKYLNYKDLTIEQVFKYVRTDVYNKTNKKQRPVQENLLIGEDDFYFNKREIKEESLTLVRLKTEEFLNKYYETIESKSIDQLYKYYNDTVDYFFDFHNLSADSIINISKSSFNKYKTTNHTIDWRKLEVYEINNFIGASYEMEYTSITNKTNKKFNRILKIWMKLIPTTESFKIISIYEVIMDEN